jgi:hypothetical protein
MTAAASTTAGATTTGAMIVVTVMTAGATTRVAGVIVTATRSVTSSTIIAFAIGVDLARPVQAKPEDGNLPLRERNGGKS